MKIGKHKRDTKWNYGISWDRAYEMMRGYNLRIWFYKNDELIDQGMLKLKPDHGFRFEMFIDIKADLFIGNKRRKPRGYKKLIRDIKETFGTKSIELMYRERFNRWGFRVSLLGGQYVCFEVAEKRLTKEIRDQYIRIIEKELELFSRLNHDGI